MRIVINYTKIFIKIREISRKRLLTILTPISTMPVMVILVLVMIITIIIITIMMMIITAWFRVLGVGLATNTLPYFISTFLHIPVPGTFVSIYYNK